MARLEMNFLGLPVVFLDGNTLSFATRKTLGLFIYLVIEAKPQSREKLAALLWPDSNEEKSRTALRRTLSRLNDALGNLPCIGGSRDTIFFDPSSLDFWLDLKQLEAARKLTLARDAHLIALETAAMLYKGDFLEGFSLPDAPEFEDWMAIHREQTRQDIDKVLARITELRTERGEQALALEAAQRRLHLDSLNEQACRALLQVQFSAGEHSAALETFSIFKRRSYQELGLEPSAQTLSIVERIRNELDQGKQNRKGSLTPSDALTTLLQDRMVGRALQHAQLVDLFYRAIDKKLQIAVLEGEAGIGKTRLALDFLRWVRARGATVIRGKGTETGGSLAYQPLVDALRPYLYEIDPRSLLSDTWLSELSRLLPELRDRCPSLPPPLSDEAGLRMRLFESVVRLTQAIASRSPLVWFMDDLQWSDPAMLELVHYLADRLAQEQSPILLLFAVRSEALASDPTLAAWLSNLARDFPQDRIKLGSLAPTDTLELVQSLNTSGSLDRTHAELAEWLFSETKGQPLFIVETLKSLVERELFTPTQDKGWQFDLKHLKATTAQLGIVPGVRNVIEARYNRLSLSAFELLAAGAVVAQGFDFDLLCAVSGLETSQGLPALDELCRGRVLLEAEGGYVFSHDKLREVAYQVAGDARRKVFHRRALEALEATQAPAAILVHHALALKLKEPILRYSIKAGLEAYNLIAYQAAIVHLERARDLLTEPDLAKTLTAEERLSIYDGLRQAYYVLGKHEDMLASCEAIVALGQEVGNLQIEHHGLRQLVWHSTNIWNILGEPDLDKTEAFVRQETEVAARSGSEVLQLMTEWDWGFYEYHRGWTQQARERTQRLIDRLLSSDEEEIKPFLIWAYSLLCRTCDGCGDWVGSYEAAKITLDLCSPENLYWLADNSNTKGEAEIRISRVLEGIETLRRGLLLSQGMGWIAGEWQGTMMLAMGLIELGELSEATAIASKAREISTAVIKTPHPFDGMAWGVGILGLQATGQLEQAQKVIDEGMIHNSFPPRSPYFLSAACGASVLSGNWAKALEYAKAAHTGDAWIEFGRYERSAELPRWAETLALFKGGEVEMAKAGVERLGRERINDNKRLRICYLRSRAVLEEWEGHTKQALATLQEAFVLTEELDLPNECWQLGGEVAQLMENQGNVDGAAQLRNQALQITHALANKILDQAIRQTFLEFSSRRIVTSYF